MSKLWLLAAGVAHLCTRAGSASCEVGESNSGWQARVDLTREECEGYCVQHRDQATGDWDGVRTTPWDCGNLEEGEFRNRPQGCLVKQAGDGTVSFTFNSLVSGHVCGKNGFWCVQCFGTNEVGTCENVRDNSHRANPGRNNLCYDQLQGSWGRSKCQDYLNWKDCDRSCDLCACSTTALKQRTAQHCSGHGTCRASCTKLGCDDARCECDEGWSGEKCGTQLDVCDQCYTNEDKVVEKLLQYQAGNLQRSCQENKPDAPGPDDLDFKNNPRWSQESWDLGCTGEDANEAACQARCQSYSSCCKGGKGCWVGDTYLAPQVANFCSGGNCCARSRGICKHGCTEFYRLKSSP